MSADALLRLASAALPPERLRAMLDAAPPERVLRRLLAGGGEVPDETRAALAVDAAVRRDELAAAGAEFVVLDGRFPADHALGRLRDRPDAPAGLFVRGTVPRGPTVAVIGTRRCTAYGRDLAFAYGRAIAEAGWVLVSGLARGIDGAAHRGTVAARGRGIAVLGCGIDVAYPAAHVPLKRRLVDLGGTVVSEYPLGTRPEPWRFPPRNRIISGLSQAVVVVEAPVRGGSGITVAHALDHGVPVFAVPGDVDRASSEGCNRLIRDGAQPVLGPDDLIEELSLVVGPPRADPDRVPRALRPADGQTATHG